MLLCFFFRVHQKYARKRRDGQRLPTITIPRYYSLFSPGLLTLQCPLDVLVYRDMFKPLLLWSTAAATRTREFIASST